MLKLMGALCGAALAATIAASPAEARPVSYEGGWTVIEMTDRQATTGIVHYTLNPSLSLGYRAEWDRRDDMLFNGVQATWLARRWFGKDYQANLYFFGGAGVAHDLENDVGAKAAGLVGVMADWETRRWFVSYRAHGFAADDLDRTAMQAARVGVAPYVANTGALHTWLMVEVDHRPDNPEPVGVTPLVRFFKGPAMLEAGWSVTDDRPLLNFIYRF